MLRSFLKPSKLGSYTASGALWALTLLSQVGACLSGGLPQALLSRLDWRGKERPEGEEVSGAVPAL